MKTFALVTAVMAAAALGNTCNLGYPGKFKCYNASFSDLVRFPTKYNNMRICVNGIAASVTNLPTYSGKHNHTHHTFS